MLMRYFANGQTRMKFQHIRQLIFNPRKLCKHKTYDPSCQYLVSSGYVLVFFVLYC